MKNFPSDARNAEARLKCVISSHGAALRTGGIPGIPQDRTTTFTSDDGTWRITVPTEHFGNFQPGMMAMVTIGIVQPFIAEMDPADNHVLSGLILPPGTSKQ